MEGRDSQCQNGMHLPSVYVSPMRVGVCACACVCANQREREKEKEKESVGKIAGARFYGVVLVLGAVRTQSCGGFHRPKTRRLSPSNLHCNHQMQAREWSASSVPQSAIWHSWWRWSRALPPPCVSWRRSPSPFQVQLGYPFTSTSDVDAIWEMQSISNLLIHFDPPDLNSDSGKSADGWSLRSEIRQSRQRSVAVGVRSSQWATLLLRFWLLRRFGIALQVPRMYRLPSVLSLPKPLLRIFIANLQFALPQVNSSATYVWRAKKVSWSRPTIPHLIRPIKIASTISFALHHPSAASDCMVTIFLFFFFFLPQPLSLLHSPTRLIVRVLHVYPCFGYCCCCLFIVSWRYEHCRKKRSGFLH